MTGKPALPPAWSFGLWLTTSFTINYDEKTTSSFIDGMAERNIPLRVFHFDCCWINPYIAQETDFFREGLEHGYFVMRKDGKGPRQLPDYEYSDAGGAIQTELEVNYTDKGVI